MLKFVFFSSCAYPNNHLSSVGFSTRSTTCTNLQGHLTSPPFRTSAEASLLLAAARLKRSRLLPLPSPGGLIPSSRLLPVRAPPLAPSLQGQNSEKKRSAIPLASNQKSGSLISVSRFGLGFASPLRIRSLPSIGDLEYIGRSLPFV
jgi:hypothetical protein